MNEPRVKIRRLTVDVAGHAMPCEITYVDGVAASVHWLDHEAMRALQVQHIAQHGEPAMHATPCSGAISIQDIRNEFYGGGGPANLGELGQNVLGRPWGQQVALSEFYCRSKIVTTQSWITAIPRNNNQTFTDYGNFIGPNNGVMMNGGGHSSTDMDVLWGSLSGSGTVTRITTTLYYGWCDDPSGWYMEGTPWGTVTLASLPSQRTHGNYTTTYTANVSGPTSFGSAWRTVWHSNDWAANPGWGMDAALMQVEYIRTMP